MRTDELDYELPEHLMAREPIEPTWRGTPDGGRSRRQSPRPPTHARVRDLPGFLEPGDLLVLNTTRVLPARVPVTRAGGGLAEVLLLEDRRRLVGRRCAGRRRLPEGSTVLSRRSDRSRWAPTWVMAAAS
ncbi:MAG: S-adenosylmethionine:tRNA ribosyltransferase-isomerase [Microthrixaceae bacterium]